ncbi:glycoside hydrolase family 105 protein [Bacillus sp. PS06]|uniref:glycoside hydrolase family 88/105 protein n=1 Tax=Bacillus sp. PS06 TaxID=2764176 RepID=UPI001CD8F954|nr:glycoside hydrolase family 88 protein [Bacillus sp. PS06]
MNSYIHMNDSVFLKQRDHIEGVLETIANRYIGDNPPHPVAYRAFHYKSPKRLKDYRYHFNINEYFPNGQEGQYVYAWGKIWQDKKTDIAFAVNCFGPVQLYLNGEIVYRNTIVEELDPDKKTIFPLPLEKGWNHLVLRFKKTMSGWGGIAGTGSYKRHPLHFLTPTDERNGQEGWLFSEPLDHTLDTIPTEDTENSTEINWLPNQEALLEDGIYNLSKFFGSDKNYSSIAWTTIHNESADEKQVQLQVTSVGPIEIYLNEDCVFRTEKDTNNQIKVNVTGGHSDLVVKSTSNGGSWGFQLQPISDDVYLSLPVKVEGTESEWLFAGPFNRSEDLHFEELLQVDTLIESIQGPTFWRVDEVNTWVRPYLENTLFGKWDYPLGVTLYGLLKTAIELKRDDIVKYCIKHIQTSTSLYSYSLWDREKYGAAGVNNQLSAIDSLDDCGSFGATMLMAMELSPIKDGDLIAKDIANYIENIQARLPEGTLYRRESHVDFMKDTIWCDDLYMSIPFLSRYYKKTGDRLYIDDSVNQFLQYKKFLYMPESQIMSHVYNLKLDTGTHIPWGRGNGWVIFSLAELLTVLPEDHEQRPELLEFFNQLSEGYLKLQGENGLWHQVLNVSESYEETSCTSMFIYAYSKGIRSGWLTDQEKYITSVNKGWQGLSKHAIDKTGNVYGVCQGSGYSFTSDYYKDDLTWILNDTHGIGIVLLAGIETRKLQKWIVTRTKELI